MSYIIIMLYYFLICFNIINNYIIIPFDIFIFNPGNNTNLYNDLLSIKFSEDIYINLTLGNPKQIIKALLRLDQYEIKIMEPNYISTLSNTFKIYKSKENKLICNETFQLLTINSSKELNDFIHKDMKNKKIIEQNKYLDYKNIKFIYLNKTLDHNFLEKEIYKQEEIDKIIRYNYAIIGLRIRHLNSDYSPEFINSLRDIKAINFSIFTFLFNKNINDDHYGYFIIGDRVIDTEKEFEETNSTYYGTRYSKLSWDLRTDSIISKPKENIKNLNVYHEKNIMCELFVEKSYFIGNNIYKNFIDEVFFNDLVEQNICQFKNLLIDRHYGTYVCNSKSKIFLDYYNNKFPDLIFRNLNIEDDLIFTKNDLFFYNPYNKSDINIYFLIYFSSSNYFNWIIGRPFLEKYRLSFDINKSKIIYHKKKLSDKKDYLNKQINNKNENKFLKSIIIIFLVLIIFFIGFLFHKLITKKPRKQKANELDDEFYYPEKNNHNKKLYNDDLDINSNDNKNNFFLELGKKNI